MSEADTAALMEEFKVLSQMARSGQALSPAQQARRKELRGYLKDLLLSPAGSTPTSTASPTPSTASPSMPLPAVPTSSAPTEGTAGANQPLDPSWAPTELKADEQAVREAQEAADAYTGRAPKDPRPDNPQEAGQLYLKKKAQSVYSAPVDDYHVSAYYADYLEAGYSFVDDQTITVAPSSPAPETNSDSSSSDAVPFSEQVPRNLAFLDDYPILYELGILPTSKRRVILHMMNGQTRRGVVPRLQKGDATFRITIAVQGTEKTGTVQMDKVRAIFVQSLPNEETPPPKGKIITVTFNDRRSIQGVTNDYAPEASIFTLVPQAANNQFERVIVNAKSIIAVEER